MKANGKKVEEPLWSERQRRYKERTLVLATERRPALRRKKEKIDAGRRDLQRAERKAACTLSQDADTDWPKGCG
jgi:hypothetical protein